MKKICFAFACLLLFSACTPKLVPLKGSYPSTPIIYTSTKPFNVVWDKLVDFFAQQGYSIKIIDKSSGLIVASTTKLSATYESKKGVLVDRNALVVVERLKSVDPSSKWTPRPVIIGDWNVRIKEVSGGTSININLVNLQREYTVGSGYYSKRNTVTYQLVNGQTTGNFEKIIYEAIN